MTSPPSARVGHGRGRNTLTCGLHTNRVAAVRAIVALLFLAVGFGANELAAASRLWHGLGTDNNFTTLANWDSGPVSGDSLFFTGTNRLTATNDFQVNTAFTDLTFGAEAGPFVLHGNPITLNGNITNSQSIDTETIGFGLNLAVTPFVSVVSNGSLTISGPISGPVGLVKIGLGLLTLGGANAYTGNTLVSAGTLDLSGGGSISASTHITVASGATLDASGRTDRTLALASGQTLTGDGSILGRVTISAGSILAPCCLGTNGMDGVLTLNSNLTLAGLAVMEVNRTNVQSSTTVTGITTVAYDGILTVANTGPGLQAGDCFALFAATNYTGAFAAMNLPSLEGCLAWDTSNLAVNGSLCVLALPALAITCPAPITTNITGTEVALIYPNPSVTGGALVDCTPPSGSNFPLGTTPVICAISNVCATETCTFSVTVNNLPAPCPRSNEGTNFWLAFPANGESDSTNHPALSLGIVGVPGIVGQVTIPGLAFATNFTIPAGGISTIDLPSEADLGPLNDAVTNKGVHVTAQSEVTVYASYQSQFPSGIYPALSTDAVGTEYIVLARGDVSTDPLTPRDTQFIIVGTEDGTRVTFIPSVTTGGYAAGFPQEIGLNAGEIYVLRNASNDLSGTFIDGDKPFAAFVSQQCARVPNSNTCSGDLIAGQLLPNAALGTNFVSLPLATTSNGSTFRFVATQPNTSVTINGTVVATLDYSYIFDQLVSGSAWITSDKPISVIQYANRPTPDGLTASAAFMVPIPPTTLFREEYTVLSPTNATSHYLNLVVPDSLVGFVWLNGVAISAGHFSPIPSEGPPSGFSGAQLAMTPGLNTLTQTSPQAVPFGATVYGFGSSSSYGYPAGVRLGDVHPPTITALPELTVTIDPELCAAVVPAIAAVVRDDCTPDDLLRVVQSPPAGALVAPGSHEITLTAMDTSGHTSSSVTVLTVLDSVSPTLRCPANIEAYAIDGVDYQVVEFVANAHSSCYPELPVECEPPSGAAFPVGATAVNCTVSGADTNAQCTFTVNVRRPELFANLESETNVVLRWEGPALLESASEVTGPWQIVDGASSPFSIALSQSGSPARRFFHLSIPHRGPPQSTCHYPNRYRELLIGADQVLVRRDIYYARPGLDDGFPLATLCPPFGLPHFVPSCCRTATEREDDRNRCRWYDHTYDLFVPRPAIDNCARRAMVVMIHGGVFLGGSKEGLDAYATIFAQAGYVVATVNYRRADPTQVNGQYISAPLVCSGYQPWLAMQDVYAALNHIRAHSAHYRVDPDKIFLFGTSAGGVAALHQVYADDDDLSSWAPAAYAFLGGKTALARFPGLPVKVAGIATFAGGIYRSQLYDPFNSVPSLMIHGTCDPTVPYNVAASTFCGANGPLIYGSRWIFNQIIADSPNVAAKFYERCGFNHLTTDSDHVPFFHAIGNFFADVMDGAVPASECVLQVCPNVFPACSPCP